LYWCTDGLLWGRNGIEGWKYKGLSSLGNWLSTYLWAKTIKGIRVGYLQSKSSSQSQL
jgi:hypothetical protein